jgi:hypothetical protein
MMTDHAPSAPAPAPEGAIAATRFTLRSLREFFKRNLTPKSGAAVVAWRIEDAIAGPMALAFVASLGRWNGALATGTVMAIFAGLFLFLLDGERVIGEMRKWVGDRQWGQWGMRIAERRDTLGALQRAASVPATLLLVGPFWRAVMLHIFKVSRPLAYVISVGGQFPRSLFWTGIVLGSLYGLVIQPAAAWLWDAALGPVLDPVWDAALDPWLQPLWDATLGRVSISLPF